MHPKYTHKLDTRAKVVPDRKAWMVEIARGQAVAHFGCCGSTPPKENRGAGGNLHERLSQVAANLRGLDNNDEWIAELVSMGHDVVYADFEDPNHPEIIGACRTCEVLMLPEVLEHLSNPGILLDTIRGTSYRGRLVVSVPNAFSLYARLSLGLAHEELVHEDHVAWYSPTTLTTLLARHGFVVRELLYYQWPKQSDTIFSPTGIESGWPFFADGILAVATCDGLLHAEAL